MASLWEIMSEQEKTNWLKAWLALNITKIGLHDFVDREVQHFQNSILQSSNLGFSANPTCKKCYTANLLPCPTQGICKKRGRNPVCKSMHDTPGKQYRPCPNGICDNVRDAIIKAHRFAGPSWKNTEADQWACNHWELGKCYMPPDGYISVKSIHDTDFNGVISVMLNCTHFDNKMSFSIARPQPGSPCLLTKVRDICKAVRHSSNCTVTSTDLKDYFQTLITLLSDSLILAHNRDSQDAVKKLKQLQTDSLNMADLSLLLRDARETLQQAKLVSEESKTTLKTLIDSMQTAHSTRAGYNYEKAVEEFRQLLIQHYIRNVAQIPISTLMPGHVKSVMDIYASPAIYRIQTDKNGSRKKAEQIHTYADIFHSEKMTNKHIFLQGEPGKGKSTFAAKLVIDWCNEIIATKQFSKKKSDFNAAYIMHTFKFVFHIALRESRKERKVVDMIKKQIIDMLYDDEDDIKEAYKLLLNIMTKETCLVVQDGLDEWSDPDGNLPFPLLAAQCVVFITTRPWKMSYERLKTSQVDCLLEIEGVNEPFALSKSVLECLITENLETQYETFKSYIDNSNLTELFETPMLLTLIVCLWAEQTFLTGSACEVYSILLDSLLKKADSKSEYFQDSSFTCFKNTKYIKPNIEQIKNICNAAFHLLCTDEMEERLVFNDRVLLKYLSEQEKVFALTMGILTERKLATLSIRPSTCSFIHKSVQEFLAAVHIASNFEPTDGSWDQYFKSCHLKDLDMRNVFKFLCGLNITAANRVFCAIEDDLDEDSSDNKVYLQQLMLRGYAEAKANNCRDDDLNLQLRCFINSEVHNTEDLKRIYWKSLPSYRFLTIEYLENYYGCGNIPNKLTPCSTCMPFYPCTLRERSFRHETTLTCTCEGFHFDGCGKPWSIHLDGQVIPTGSCLHNLESITFKDECDCFTYIDRVGEKVEYEIETIELSFWEDTLDLSSCRSLTCIELGDDVTWLPNSLRDFRNLQILILRCKCAKLDLSECFSLQQIELGENVTLLPMQFRILKNLKRIALKCTYAGPDLSACNNLKSIYLGTKVTLLPTPLRDLPYLKKIYVNCTFDGLDLSNCNSLRKIHLGDEVKLLPDGLRGLHKMNNIILRCICDGLDLSSYHSLTSIELGQHVQLLPNALRGLPKLEKIYLYCKYEGLDLSSCTNLRDIELCNNVTLFPNGLRGLPKLEKIYLYCKYEGLDLSSCTNLRDIDLGKNVTLLPNGLRGHPKLKKINFNCEYEGLDLVAYTNLKALRLYEYVTLLPNALRGLPKLSEIQLRCKCDGLDLQACNKLHSVYLGENVTLVPNALCGLPNLIFIDLECACYGLDLSACVSLSHIKLGKNVTLLPNALRGLPKLRDIKLRCKCDGLDLQACNELYSVYLGENVTLVPNALCGLPNLKFIDLECACYGLDLSACVSLWHIKLGKNVTLLPNALRGLPKLWEINLRCKCDRLDLSGCNKLQTMKLGENVTYLPNSFLGLPLLCRITLRCKCDGHDLSECKRLRNIELGENVTLLPKSLLGLSHISTIILKKSYDVQRLSSCNSVWNIYIDEHFELLPNALRGWLRWKKIT